MKILDAGWGQQGFFTLVQDSDGTFVHYNARPTKGYAGYMVFQVKEMDEVKAQEINRYLAEVIAKEEMVFTATAGGGNDATEPSQIPRKNRSDAA